MTCADEISSARMALAKQIADGDERMISVLADLLDDLGEDATPWRRYQDGDPDVRMDVFCDHVYLTEPAPPGAGTDRSMITGEQMPITLPDPVTEYGKPEVVASREALRIAHALASWFGHQWGNVDFRLVPAGGASATQIDWLTRQTTSQGPVGWGITCPGINPGGNVTHETATGRFFWQVAPDGDQASVHVCRPAGEVLVVVATQGSVRVERINLQILLHQRHVEDAAGAVRGLADAYGADAGPALDALARIDRVCEHEAESPDLVLVSTPGAGVPAWGVNQRPYVRGPLDWWCRDATGQVVHFATEDDAARAWLRVRDGGGVVAAASAVNREHRGLPRGVCVQCHEAGCDCR